MNDMGAKRLVLALAIHRIPGLRAEERLLVWDLVDDELSLSLLLRHDLEAAVGRSLGRSPWSPGSLLEAASADAEYLGRRGCRFVQFDDPGYPAELRETARPPFGLFARGEGPDPGAESIAIVGTRMPTGRGLDASFALARDLAASGAMIVSGLARGIDAAAHRGALAGGGRTCAVLPCGIDLVYPPANRGLAAEILESGGLLLSEYPPGTSMHRFRFPERNRIIAGMSRACVVVEAPAKSGALITAEHALDEGRDVWVSAECLGGQRSAGIDRLAEEGAPALGDAAELLADLAASRRRDRAADLSKAGAGGGLECPALGDSR